MALPGTGSVQAYADANGEVCHIHVAAGSYSMGLIQARGALGSFPAHGDDPVPTTGNEFRHTPATQPHPMGKP